ncbi:MFS transporter [Streptomyces sp. NRRL S-15]|uniref:MFS transporter n=1 Tax=Streptomyces sp. NRRL S-15 TaxID=1463886 RepID=UPI0004C77AEB|nr:MFS transporter [Streptomyces sp. NRRL S-15]
MSTSAIEKVNGHALAAEPRFDPVALAEADAIRTKADADAKAARIKAEAAADAARTLATEEAEKQRIANERAAMRLEKEKADHAAHLAEKAAKTAKANAEREKAEEAAAEQEKGAAQLAAEQERTERMWKLGARAIYGVGLIIAAPVQFLAFWDPKRPFLVAAPALLEGLALVLAFGAAWAVAHRRDVMPYRIGIMMGALIAAGINLWHGATDEAIGLNAGLIGAIASLGGPVVLMAYEHGIAQKADGIPSWREKRATARAEAEERAARKRVASDKRDAEHAAAQAKALAESRAVEEQKRRDTDRQQGHPEVWAVAEAMRSARGAQHVTEQIWADAWQRVTGSKTVGITAEIEARSRAAEARMTTVTKTPVLGEFSLVGSQIKPRQKKGPEAPDGRRKNGGTPPVRRPGDTQPYSEGARRQIGRETASRKVEEAGE